MLKRTLKSFTLSVIVACSLAPSANAQSGFWADLFNHKSDCIQFTATEEFLFMGRDKRLDHGNRVIGGPDAGLTSFENDDFQFETGYRVSMGIETMEHRWEAIFAEYGDWVSNDRGSLTAGLSFDGSIPANWPAGSNFLNTTTFFTPLHVASTAALGGEGDEADGLGPNNAFADTLPTYSSYYRSSLQDLQINLINNDNCAEVRVGIGYRNLQLEEEAGITIAGTYRAANAGNGGLSHATLTGPAGLTFIGGTPNGFEDESISGNNGPADRLTLDWLGTTENQLNGFQVIVDACLIDTGRFDIKMIGKAGAFHNHASGRIRERYIGVGNDTSTYGREFSDSKDVVAFAGSVGINASLGLNEHLRLIGGYEGMFMSGLALGPEQSGGVNGNTYEVETDGNIIVHGATVGLELTY